MRLFKPNIPKMLAKKDLHGLVEALGDEDRQIVLAATEALGELDDPQAGPLLLEALNTPASRKGAIRALGLTRNNHALEPLVAALHDQDAEVRLSAAFALPMLPGPVERLVEPLAERLNDVNNDVCFTAATGLMTLKDQRGFDYLVNELHSGFVYAFILEVPSLTASCADCHTNVPGRQDAFEAMSMIYPYAVGTRTHVIGTVSPPASPACTTKWRPHHLSRSGTEWSPVCTTCLHQGVGYPAGAQRGVVAWRRWGWVIDTYTVSCLPACSLVARLSS